MYFRNKREKASKKLFLLLYKNYVRSLRKKPKNKLYHGITLILTSTTKYLL